MPVSKHVRTPHTPPSTLFQRAPSKSLPATGDSIELRVATDCTAGSKLSVAACIERIAYIQADSIGLRSI